MHSCIVRSIVYYVVTLCIVSQCAYYSDFMLDLVVLCCLHLFHCFFVCRMLFARCIDPWWMVMKTLAGIYSE